MLPHEEILVLPAAAPEPLLPHVVDIETTNVPTLNGATESKTTNVSSCAFSAPADIHNFDGILFDMDGTIIDSTRAIELHWEGLGKTLNMDPRVILATSHGRRSIDTLAEIAPSLANWEYISALEAAIPYTHAATARLLPGAASLLDTLTQRRARWTIVTSGTRGLVRGWLDVLHLSAPAAELVAAEDVPRGKPDPACYALGWQRLGLEPEARVLVVEDAPAGVRAGVAAGAVVLAVATTHAVGVLRAAGARWVVRDLESLRVVKSGEGEGEGEGGVTVEIRDAVVW